MTDTAADQTARAVDIEALIREARMHQAAILEHREIIADHLRKRNRLIHQLRASDLSYGEIVKAVGMDRGLVIWILKQPVPE
jgi:hypothetical protein